MLELSPNHLGDHANVGLDNLLKRKNQSSFLQSLQKLLMQMKTLLQKRAHMQVSAE